MKFILVAIILSGWDGSIQDTKPLGIFSSIQECQKQADQLGQVSYTRFICSEQEPK